MWLLTWWVQTSHIAYPERCAFTPISAHNNPYPYVSGRPQGGMVAGLASDATPKGLESELMGLPRDVVTHIEIAGFTSILPTCSTFTPYSNPYVGV